MAACMYMHGTQLLVTMHAASLSTLMHSHLLGLIGGVAVGAMLIIGVTVAVLAYVFRKRAYKTYTYLNI